MLLKRKKQPGGVVPVFLPTQTERGTSAQPHRVKRSSARVDLSERHSTLTIPDSRDSRWRITTFIA
jgi:hypothetical protein